MTDTEAGEPEDRRAGFTVAMNERGLWVVRECCGLIEGEFVTQGEAIRFALGELGRGRIHPAGFAHNPEPQLALHASDD
jgi:hypothetical protein